MRRLLPSCLVALTALGAHADPPAVRFFDSATGRAIEPATVTVDRNALARAPGYRAVPLRAADLEENVLRRIDVFLPPVSVPEAVLPQNIRRALREGATLLQGFVMDESGSPLQGAAVASSAGPRARTDAHGFFRMWVPSPLASDDSTLTFTAEGHEDVVREHVELWPLGDWTYRIRMTRGSGVTKVDERELRTRGHGGEDDLPGMQDLAFVPAPAASAIDATVSIPSTIRIGVSTGVVEYRTLDDYCRFVLPAEWIPSWALLAGGLGVNSLRAGAVAIRTYAIGFVQQPLSATSYDICATTSCQKYTPSLENSWTTQAVQDTTGVVLVNAAGSITYKMTEYSAENNAKSCYDLVGGVKQYKTCTCPDGSTGDTPNCIADPVCTGEARNGHGRGMCQWGSSRWASGLFKGTPHAYGTRSWQEILQIYYPALTIAQGTPLATGDRIRTARSGVGVRECSAGGIAEGQNCPSIAPDRGDAASGTIVSGPQWVTASGTGGLTWWRIRWDSDGATGWSSENHLRRTLGASSDQTSFGGTVVDARTGSPVAGALVTWGPLSATTATDGTYSFANVECRTETLTVAKSGYATVAQSYAPTCGTTSVKTVLLGNATLKRRSVK